MRPWPNNSAGANSPGPLHFHTPLSVHTRSTFRVAAARAVAQLWSVRPIEHIMRMCSQKSWMRLWLPLIATVFGISLGVLAQTTSEKTWRFGPYDKSIAPKPSDIAPTSPPPPALRGAIVPSKTGTNPPATPAAKKKSSSMRPGLTNRSSEWRARTPVASDACCCRHRFIR